MLQQTVAIVEVGGNTQVHDADQLVDRSSGARAAEDDAGIVVAADSIVNYLASTLAQSSCLQTCSRRFGVRVRVARQHLITNEVFDERQRSAGGGVVGVCDPARPVGPVHHLIIADDRLAYSTQ